MWPFRKSVEEGEPEGLAGASLSQPPGSSSWSEGVWGGRTLVSTGELQ